MTLGLDLKENFQVDSDALHALEVLHTRPQGLSENEAILRLKKNGHNELPKEIDGAGTILIRQLKSPLLLILIFATITSYILGQRNPAITMFIMLVVSVFIGFINEFRSEKIIRDLNAHFEPATQVIRDNVVKTILSKNVTIGDLVPLTPGTIVAADMILVDDEGLEADESILTGEAVPVKKHRNSSNSDNNLKSYMVYSGTHISSGHGIGVVHQIGASTEFGIITKSVARIRPETEFQRGTKNFGFMLVRVITTIAILIFMINALLARNILDSILFSLVIAIGLTPELLPAIISVSLARGAFRMAKKKVVVKQLISIENLGNLDILCTDKTGTLTEGRLSLLNYYNADEVADQNLLKLASWSCEKARPHHLITSPFDLAILHKIEVDKIKLDKVKYLNAIPFDFNRKRSSIAVKTSPSGLLLITKGAPESLLGSCDKVRIGNRLLPVDKYKSRIINHFNSQSNLGYRVLAYASKSIDNGFGTLQDEQKMIFEGFLVFEDKIKVGAAEAVNKLKNLGMNLSIVSGDNELVCAHVYKSLGLGCDKIMIGDQIDKYDVNRLSKMINDVQIFARVTPEQKLKIIRAYKYAKLTVGFMGDGVNDAPSLHEADVGISVSSAVDIAKDSASIVLLRRDLSTLAEGVSEGRKIFANTIKYILMGTSSNFGNMISAAFGSFFLPFLPMLPAQILLTNSLYDISQLAIPTDNVDAIDLKKPRHWDVKFIQKFMMFFGPISSLYDFATFFILIVFLNANESRFQTGWFIESLLTQTLVIYIIRTKKFPAITSSPSLPLLFSGLGMITFGIFITFTPLAKIFGFSSLPVAYLVVIPIMALTYLLLVDIMKKVFYSRYEPVTLS